MKNLKHKICVIVFLLIIGSCKQEEEIQSTKRSSIPKKYISESDSTSTKVVKWKELFFDQNLITLIDSALKNNFDLQLALQKVEMAKAGVKLNKTNALPEFNLATSAGVRKYGEYTMDGVGNFDTRKSLNINEKQQIPDPLPDYFSGLQSYWEIDIWGKLKNMRKSAYAKFTSTQLGKEFLQTQLISEISYTYFELLALDYETKILAENIKLQSEALDLVKAQKEAGRANELGVELLHAQLLSSKAIQAEVNQMIIENETKLNFLCGDFPKKINRDTTYFSNRIKEILNTGIPSDLLNNRPDIRQAEFDLIASYADLRVAKAAFYPSLTINGTLGLQSFNSALLLEMPSSLAYNLVNGLTMPLLNRRKLKSDLLLSKAVQKQSYINYEKTIVNGFKEVYVAINKIQNTKTMYDLKNQEVEILKKSISTSRELFKAGKANYLEVITSQKNALLSQIELIHFYKQNNNSIVELYKSIGGGWDK
jgi:NodT family efflux transporter outer membrane factor (OMF) lipoprotein